MKNILILILFVNTTCIVFAQKQYKVPKQEGKLILNNISKFSAEGYNGTNIVFIVENTTENNHSVFSKEDRGDDPRARGLSALNNNGFDNTGLKLNITENGKNTLVTPVGNLNESNLKIMLPYSVSLSIRNNGWPVEVNDSNAITLSNIKSEIDLSGQFENCKLIDVSGPLSIKTLSGNVEVLLAERFQGPISIQTVNGFIDLKVPDDTKATLSMSSFGGTIYADKNLILESKQISTRAGKGDFLVDSLHIKYRGSALHSFEKVDSVKSSGKDKSAYGVGFSFPYSSGSSSFEGTLNGGGQKIDLRSMRGNIYLRK